MKHSASLRAALGLAAGFTAAAVRLAAAAIPLEAAPPPTTQAEAASRFVPNFRPLPAMNAALSPDGNLLAYAFREGRGTKIAVMDIGHPERMKSLFELGSDADSTPGMTDDREETPLKIRWMRWVTPTRLVIDTNLNEQYYSRGWGNMAGVVFGVDADGKNVKTLLRPRDLVDNSHWTAGWTADSFDSEGNMRPGFLRTTGSPIYLRNPHVVDLNPNDPSAVLVQAGGRDRLYTYSLNVLTGRTKILEDDVGMPGWEPLADHAGRIRVAIDLDSKARPPFRYQLEKRRGLQRWTPLDEFAGTAAGTPGFSISPGNFFGERAIPVGFSDGPGVMYFASNVGRDTYGLYALDLATGKRTGLAVEDPNFDVILPATAGFGTSDTLVFDRYTRELAGVRYAAARETTRWLGADLRDVQETLEASLPGQSVVIQEWDQAGNRFLASGRSPSDPGAIYVYDRAKQRLWEFARRAPWLDEQKAPRVLEFAFNRPDGARISGVGLVPRFARLNEVPVVFVCPTQPWDRASPEFSARLRTVAEMGFVAVQVNPRGALGFGRKSREAINSGRWDELQADDLVATLDELARNFHIHTTRAAVLGEGIGGHLALRAAQLHPERFRAAVAINPVIDIAGWIEESRWTSRNVAAQLVKEFFGDPKTLRATPLVRQPELLTRPALVLSFPGPRGGARTFTHIEARRFASTALARGGRVDFVELEPEYQRRLPEATAAVYRQVEDFLNTTVYDFEVKLGPLTERPASSATSDPR